MSLVSLIRFRNLDAQLTDNEFFNEFTKSVGRELIIKLLFNHYKNNLNDISTINITNIQSDIINKREENQQEILSYDCIDQLPSELISECASYLNYKQYFRLGKCNRKIYIDCYSFPKIQEFKLWCVRKLMPESTDLNAFKNIQKLTMDIQDFNALSPSNKSTWCNNKSLHTLVLYDHEDDIKSFIKNQHLINYYNVKTLELYWFNSVLIFDILSKFKQVENLELMCARLDNNLNLPDKNKIKKWFPNVKSLDLGSTNRIFASNIIEALHNQLESLSVDETVTIPSNITFPKLQSLKLDPPTNVAIDLLKMSQTLKCVSLLCYSEDIINTFIDSTICKQLALENIKIEFESQNVNPVSILQKLESTFAKNRNIKRKRLCIELIFSDLYDDDKKEFGLQIFRVSNALKISNIDNWCLKIQHYYYHNDTEYFETGLNEMKGNYFVDYQIDQDIDELTVVVSNIKCFT